MRLASGKGKRFGTMQPKKTYKAAAEKGVNSS